MQQIQGIQHKILFNNTVFKANKPNKLKERDTCNSQTGQINMQKKNKNKKNPPTVQ